MEAIYSQVSKPIHDIPLKLKEFLDQLTVSALNGEMNSKDVLVVGCLNNLET